MNSADRFSLGLLLQRALGRLAGADPGFVRLRMATRVTLTVLLVGLALVALHTVQPLPVASISVGLILAMQNALAIKDRTRKDRLRTRLCCALSGFGTLLVIPALENQTRLVDGFFLLVTFLAVYARKWGPRWNAVGMFGFMACFAGAYFRPGFGDLPTIALSLCLSGLVAHGVREHLIPDRPARDFARTLRAVEERIGGLVSRIRAGRRLGWPPEARRAAIAAEQKVKDAIAVAEALLPDDAEGATRETSASRLAIKLFDLHLATETTLATALDEPQDTERPGLHLTPALDRLAKARLDLRRSAKGLTSADFAGPALALPKSGGSTMPWHREPALRLAIQVTLACAIAMAGGLWVSEQRWFWAVLTAFLVFVNTQSRGDTVLRGIDRALGTAAGIVVGILVATLVNGAFAISIALVIACVFVGFYLVQVSYGALTFFVTISLSLIYGLLGSFTPDLLVLRLKETLVGALAGMSVSFFVFPQRTENISRGAVDRFLAELDRLLEITFENRRGNASAWKVLAVTRALDRRHLDIVAAVRPLESGWIAAPRRRLVRLGLLRLAALAYWGHRLASAAGDSAARDSKAEGSTTGDGAEIEARITECRADIAALRSGSGNFFRQSGPVALTPTEALAQSRDLEAPDATLALHALRHILRQALGETDKPASVSKSEASRP
ncbi:FUSC family protein [Aureimonas ureilytica]|uniref:FUSC family protein n=1 Tax=Aureimonas ureilytica TaxID=401562 RepID=UPI0003666390|nr:FUSC family protein [Aureimonas ureilytica]